ncbi:acyltransferase domain-containing protein [Bradyrhizobium sp. Leaf401]|uniref:acyltransferase domain-containing protein n=1 Tax=Bradyrhizobium sp. Leaf401 TaxID=2876564 RepID=UPI001E3C69BF|nr:acyltransferase domain-containing protein [Bradyrhizobium sp. Leaf401]
MFSGQGSQYFQMGRELFERNEYFRTELSKLDAIAAGLLNESVIELLFDERNKKGMPFNNTARTGLAIYMIENVLANCLIMNGVRPDYLLGYSLGTYAAASVANCMDAQQAMATIIKAAAIFEEECELGFMVAVLDDPGAFLSDPWLMTKADLAASNFKGNFVLSSSQDNWVPVKKYLEERGFTFQRLDVSRAYHSRWVDSAEGRFRRTFRSLVCPPPAIPILSCAHGHVLPSLNGSSMWEVSRNTIKFDETIARLECDEPHLYLDVGPAGTLTTCLKYSNLLQPGSEALAILTPFGSDLKNFERALAFCADLSKRESPANDSGTWYDRR